MPSFNLSDHELHLIQRLRELTPGEQVLVERLVDKLHVVPVVRVELPSPVVYANVVPLR
jgi:hypothetical protein